MIPVAWQHPALVFLWQAMLHSWVAGGILYAWCHHVGLPSGQARRRVLAMLLVVPLITAAVPGRGSWEFRDNLAWFDSYRVLALPLPFDLRVFHLVLALFVLIAAITLFQELLPALQGWKAARSVTPNPDAVALVNRLVQKVPALARCSVRLLPSDGIAVETDGGPRQAVLRISSGAVADLPSDELEAVLRHEGAHVRAPRWFAAHGLFLARLLQIGNPVALWAFREYTNEVELLCDREAAQASGSRVLARALLKVYECTDRSDIAGRAALRHRVDTLLGRRAVVDDALTPAAQAVALLLLLVVLPWVV